MKIVFMGTPEPAAGILRDLIGAGHQLLLVVTQPDRPRGRGQKITSSPVKEAALKHSLPVEQPEKVKGNEGLVSRIRSLSPDVIVVVAYGRILPKAILGLPSRGCINVHASLLPKYRGAAPIQWALLNGEKETGVTVMRIDELLDTGDIILQERTVIDENDDAVTLSKKLFARGSGLLLKALAQIEQGAARYIPQKGSEATFAPAITKESGEIDWKRSARQIHDRVRALVSWPVAHTFYREKPLRILRTDANVVDLESEYVQPGTIVHIVKNAGFVVKTGGGHLLIKEVQPAAKKRMGAYDFVIGHDVKIGETLPS